MGSPKAIGPGRRIAASFAAGRFAPPTRPWFPRPHRPRTQRLGQETDANGPGGNPGPLACRDFLAQKSMSPPPPGMAGAFSFSGFSAITASVVRNRPAIEAAFCSAERVTFAGSMIPALNMST
jgi:hypothetical protein